jgi:tetratricopeptide (TPR) repeat protein
MENKEASIKDIIGRAEEAEKNKDTSGAIKLYKEILQHDDLYILAYNRLMKLYRQHKDYKKELAIINKAIKVYELYYYKHQPKHSKTISELSNKLNKAFGLVDKKGIKTYSPEPIGKWQKRKAVVEKKLK